MIHLSLASLYEVVTACNSSHLHGSEAIWIRDVVDDISMEFLCQDSRNRTFRRCLQDYSGYILGLVGDVAGSINRLPFAVVPDRVLDLSADDSARREARNSDTRRPQIKSEP